MARIDFDSKEKAEAFAKRLREFETAQLVTEGEVQNESASLEEIRDAIHESGGVYIASEPEEKKDRQGKVLYTNCKIYFAVPFSTRVFTYVLEENADCAFLREFVEEKAEEVRRKAKAASAGGR